MGSGDERREEQEDHGCEVVERLEGRDLAEDFERWEF